MKQYTKKLELEYAYADPSQAKDFVERTGCDSLAVAVRKCTWCLLC